MRLEALGRTLANTLAVDDMIDGDQSKDSPPFRKSLHLPPAPD